MRLTVLRHNDYRRVRWKNDGGWTTELASTPLQGGDGDFEWRISIAEIESDGAFSEFPHCERTIALLDGNGMQLEFDAAPAVLLERRLHFVGFAGEWKTYGRLIDGPVRDFNVIARRDRWRIEPLHRPLLGPMLFLADSAATWFVYLCAGQAHIKHASESFALTTGDSVLLQPDGGNQRAVLDGGGEVILIRLVRLDA